jgi:hypothetical protein
MLRRSQMLGCCRWPGRAGSRGAPTRSSQFTVTVEPPIGEGDEQLSQPPLGADAPPLRSKAITWAWMSVRQSGTSPAMTVSARSSSARSRQVCRRGSPKVADRPGWMVQVVPLGGPRATRWSVASAPVAVAVSVGQVKRLVNQSSRDETTVEVGSSKKQWSHSSLRWAGISDQSKPSSSMYCSRMEGQVGEGGLPRGAAGRGGCPVNLWGAEPVPPLPARAGVPEVRPVRLPGDERAMPVEDVGNRHVDVGAEQQAGQRCRVSLYQRRVL